MNTKEGHFGHDLLSSVLGLTSSEEGSGLRWREGDKNNVPHLLEPRNEPDSRMSNVMYYNSIHLHSLSLRSRRFRASSTKNPPTVPNSKKTKGKERKVLTTICTQLNSTSSQGWFRANKI